MPDAVIVLTSPSHPLIRDAEAATDGALNNTCTVSVEIQKLASSIWTVYSPAEEIETGVEEEFVDH